MKTVRDRLIVAGALISCAIIAFGIIMGHFVIRDMDRTARTKPAKHETTAIGRLESWPRLEVFSNTMIQVNLNQGSDDLAPPVAIIGARSFYTLCLPPVNVNRCIEAKLFLLDRNPKREASIHLRLFKKDESVQPSYEVFANNIKLDERGERTVTVKILLNEDKIVRVTYNKL